MKLLHTHLQGKRVVLSCLDHVLSRRWSSHWVWSLLERVDAADIAPDEPPPIAGRKYLPGSTLGGFPEHLAGPRDDLPLAVRAAPASALSIPEWGSYLRGFIDQMLPSYPALLVKGLPLRDEKDLSRVIAGLGFNLMKYVGGTGTRHRVDDVLNTASRDPPEFSIEPHNEMSHSPVFPKKVIFSCSRPASSGGETTLTDNREVLRNLDQGIVQRLVEKGLRYYSFLPSKDRGCYTSWQDRLLTESPREAERILEQKRYRYTWHQEGLAYWYDMPPLLTHPRTGEKLFFNQAASAQSSYHKASPAFEGVNLPDDRYPCHCRYGDDTEIETDVTQHIRSVSWKCSVGFRWEFGDILILDNYYIQHGRMGFTGPRRILATAITD